MNFHDYYHIVFLICSIGREGRSADDYGVDRAPDLFSLRDERNVHLCTASLIQPLLLLTAAHCILGKSLKGMKAVREGPTTLEQSLVPVSQIIIHPNFDPDTLDNDIALLRLDSDDAHEVDSSMEVASVALPPQTWKLPSKYFDLIFKVIIRF